MSKVRFEPPMQAPTERIRLIERSLHCFALGSLSLIPVLGLPLAGLVFVLHWRVWMESEREWNPARPYLLAGFCLAGLGIIISLGVLALLAVALLNGLFS